MATRSHSSLAASQVGLRQAEKSLTDLRLTKVDLSRRAGCAKSTVANFFSGKRVDKVRFAAICSVLNLEWAEVALATTDKMGGDTLHPSISQLVPEFLEIEDLVQQVRNHLRPLIQHQCGTMRVLDMDQPIELTGQRGIYTNINILEKLTRLRSERDLLEESKGESDVGDDGWDRLMLGRLRQKQVPGLQAVEQHQRLMVLGKPGAGKTTFLKYLAMQCIAGNFAAESVPFFVTLKDFAEAEHSPDLVQYLARVLQNLALGDVKTKMAISQAVASVETLLSSGRAIILLDGLDEVRQEDTSHVINSVRAIADHFVKSQFVITCRIAAKEYTFEHFTEVEVADFDSEQILTFVENWFRAKNDQLKAGLFVQKLIANRPIQELAQTPLLLTLLCLVFGEGGDFPSNRAVLYEEGVKILLKKWDAKRNIQRDNLYEKLDVQRREDLLSYIALKTFEQKEYFVKQRRLEGYIADFISNLRDVDPNPEALRMDSEVILKTIQAQHGLLVERARGIYSFSHLTFQEYFAAREIVGTNCLDVIVSSFEEKRWREVSLLTVGMLRNADEMLLEMKNVIDYKLAGDNVLQQFLQWAMKNSVVVEAYKPSAIRAFYFSFGLAYKANLDFALNLDLRNELDFTLNPQLDSTLAIVLSLALSIVLDPTKSRALARDLDINLVRVRDFVDTSNLKRQLDHLRHRLPDISTQNPEHFNEWWQKNGAKWISDLRKIMITHRNIGHDWKFTNDQQQRLQQYYDANLLLVQCLNSDCYVSRAVRQEIKDTLLLPIAEIEARRNS